MKTQIKDGREEIYRALYRALNSKAKFLEASAWYVGVVGGPESGRIGGQRPIVELWENAKSGRFGEVMEACAQLGEWWLAKPMNAGHLMRADVEAHVAACRNHPWIGTDAGIHSRVNHA